MRSPISYSFRYYVTELGQKVRILIDKYLVPKEVDKDRNIRMHNMQFEELHSVLQFTKYLFF